MNKDEIAELLDIPDFTEDDQLMEFGPNALVEDDMIEGKFDTYLKTTNWDQEQGKRCKDEILANSPNLLHSDIIRDCYANPTYGDFYASVYNRNPEVQGPCKDEFRHKFMEDMMQLPDYHSLHESTKGNLIASDAACSELFKKYSDYLKNQEGKYEVDMNYVNNKGELQPIGIKVNGEKEDEFASLAFAADAVKAAQEKVEEFEETCKGWGLDPGANSPADIARIKEMFFITQKNARVREIMKRAGRFRRSAQARQREKVIHGQDDITGVEVGGDISRLLPAELSKITHPLLKKDMMRRLVERQCIQREMRGVEFKEKGPIIVCVDESGSMEGENFYCAKALALAMVWIAQHQKREIVLYSFSSGEQHEKCFVPKKHAIREDQGDRRKLAQWLEHFYRGGTTLDVPLTVVPEQWDGMAAEGHIKAEKTDMIIITDAVVGFSNEMRDKFLQWKLRSKCKVITLVLGTEAGRMKEFSDEVFCFSSINVGTEAVNSCFSV